MGGETRPLFIFLCFSATNSSNNEQRHTFYRTAKFGYAKLSLRRHIRLKQKTLAFQLSKSLFYMFNTCCLYNLCGGFANDLFAQRFASIFSKSFLKSLSVSILCSTTEHECNTVEWSRFPITFPILEYDMPVCF